MLDRMLESKSDASENARRSRFLITTLFLVTTMLSGAMLYSLYAKPLGAINEDLELPSLVAPVALEVNKPAEIPTKELNNSTNVKTAETIMRIVNQKSIDESPDVPKEISTVNNRFASRPPAPFKIGASDSDVKFSNNNLREESGNKTGVSLTPKQPFDNEDEKEPPRMQPKISGTQQPKSLPKQSLGVINGMAKNLPIPVYPAAAKAVHAQGTVNVQVTIDEEGKVVSASAVSGHPLLRQSAELAARRATFSPTMLSKIPVKVTGVIIYNFVAP